jgi:hypothetical protein
VEPHSWCVSRIVFGSQCTNLTPPLMKKNEVQVLCEVPLFFVCCLSHGFSLMNCLAFLWYLFLLFCKPASSFAPSIVPLRYTYRLNIHKHPISTLAIMFHVRQSAAFFSFFLFLLFFSCYKVLFCKVVADGGGDRGAFVDEWMRSGVGEER